MLELRLLEKEDYSKIVEWNRGRDADFLYQWAGPGYDYPITEEKIAKRIENCANREGADTYIYKILLEDSKEMIGTIELCRVDRIKRSASIGRFLLADKHQGCGYGRTALKMLVDLYNPGICFY